MTTKKELHDLVDWLPKGTWKEAHHLLLEYLKRNAPVLYALYTAPEGDEPETEDERAAMAEAYESIAKGERMIPDDELAQELGL